MEQTISVTVGIEDVAKLARVSAATVSRALTRPEMVAARTRERVVAAADQLGYRPNHAARSLRTRESRALGLFVTDILNPFHATLAKGVQDAAEAHGFTVYLFNTDEAPDKERRLLLQLRSHLPQGLIIVPTDKTRENLRLIPGLPVIEIDRASGTPGAHAVMVENASGARQAVEHLISLGHQRIGMVAGKLNVTTAVERLQGYRDALRGAGLKDDDALVVFGDHREEGGRLAARNLLELPLGERPTALFVGNNEMTAGAILACHELGLTIPGDISIVGFDDSRWSQLMQPSLTVVAQPTYDLGHIACETLLAMLRRGNSQHAATVRLATQLIIRASTATPSGVHT